MKDLIKSRQFWRIIALMIGISLLIVALTIASLRWFTRHGQSYEVPDFTGLSIEQLISLENEYDFTFVIIDSVFDQTRQPGTVLKHDPLPGSTVKRGRKFYVTLVSSVPDMAKMPNLIDLSLRQATVLLQASGLNVGEITYQPDRFQNAVLDQLYRGKHIAPGEKIRVGSYINLVVSGSGSEFAENDTITENTETTEDLSDEF